MAETTGISWADHTFNPWWGCTKVSQGCKFCYAERDSKRHGFSIWGPRSARRFFSDNHWNQPILWNKKAMERGERSRVFCASMADVFEGPETLRPEDLPRIEEARKRLWDLIDATPHLDWLILTKRPENIIPFWLTSSTSGPDPVPLPNNVWIGTSAEDQATLNERLLHLIKVPARVRFLSLEPLIGPIDLSDALVPDCDNCDGAGGGEPNDCNDFVECSFCDGTGKDWFDRMDDIHWVIVGGESGPKASARPMALGWVKDIVGQCKLAGVPVFVKQLGDNPTNREGEPCPHITSRAGREMHEWPEELRVRQFPEGA